MLVNMTSRAPSAGIKPVIGRQLPRVEQLLGRRLPQTQLIRQSHRPSTSARRQAARPQTARMAADADTYKCWSNLDAQVLTGPILQNVYAAERAFVWNTIDVGGRCAVVKLRDGSLWVHSPVALDDHLREALKELGEVKHVVSPNFEHVKYAQQWIDAFPEATSYCPPGGKEHFPGIAFAEELESGRTSPEQWGGEIECLFLDYEHNPFTKKPFFNEVAFLHKPSGTIMTADLFWNYPDKGVPFTTTLWKLGMDKLYLPFYLGAMICDKPGFDAAARVLMEEWEWDALLPCHGRVLLEGGKDAMRRHLGL